MTFDNEWLQGVFERDLPAAGLAVREEQLAMANYVQSALAKNRHLIAEAGVGTGKTFAYAIPAFGHILQTHAPVLVATHTIALQEQLVRHDLPAVSQLLDMPMQVLLAKGKEHYLCPARLEAYKDEHPEPSEEALQLFRWARRTRTGDRAEGLAASEPLWQAVNWGDRGPCRRSCQKATTCPSARQRQKLKEAHGFIVTNHHQFFADLGLRAQGRHLFAQPGAIILDEAHALLDAARDVLGARSSPRQLVGAARGASLQLQRGDAAGRAAEAAAEAWGRAIGRFAAWQASEEATRFELRREGALDQLTTACVDAAIRVLGRLGGLAATPAREAAFERLETAIAPLRHWLLPASHVVWVEGRPGGEVTAIASAPRELAALLAQRLFDRGVPVILTSATLSAAGDFGYMKRAFGLERPLTCSVGSPFDYPRQARLYMPDDLPDPGQDVEAFYAAAIERLKALLEATGGRALLLFTAKSRAAQAAKALEAWGHFPIVRQDRAQADPLGRFKAEPRAVLIGTGYWEGIDVPGETLSCVVVVKLPFPPGDPLLTAREQAARAQGLDPFEEVLLPEMLLKLRQGAGRLIRRDTDRGVVAVLDPRARTRERYAQRVAAALPEAPRLETLAAVRDFLGAAGPLAPGPSRESGS